MCDLVDNGRIITIDVRERQPHRRPRHPRIEYRTGSSIAPEIVAGVHEAVQPGERVMVILDSDHSQGPRAGGAAGLLAPDYAG